MTTVSHTAIMYNLNISQGNVSMGKGTKGRGPKKRHVYMAYLAILSILFVHENSDRASVDHGRDAIQSKKKSFFKQTSPEARMIYKLQFGRKLWITNKTFLLHKAWWP